jgi:hypothetical protein
VREAGAAAWARGTWIVDRYRYRYGYRVLCGHQNGSPGIPSLVRALCSIPPVSTGPNGPSTLYMERW